MRLSLRLSKQAILCFGLLAAATGFGGELPEVDADIDDVLSGGTLRHDYRLVVACGGFEHVQCEVWAQWLKHDPETGTRVARSTPIKELNGHGYVVGRLERAFAANDFRAVASVTHTHVLSATGRFEIELDDLGEYKFRWLQEPSFAEVE
jgi:hypothetical protein